MDSLDQVKKLREEYERALDTAESHRAAYHEAVLDLHRSGTPLREIAKELGLSHQRVHQIVTGEPPRRRNLGRAAGGAAGALVLIAATFGALRIVHAPPFVQTVQVPAVIAQEADFAAGPIVREGLNVRVIYRRKNIGMGLVNHVYAQVPDPGRRVAKGGTVTLYAEIPAKHFTCRTPTGPCPTTVLYHALH
jgi:predicted transcriptional regulator